MVEVTTVIRDPLSTVGDGEGLAHHFLWDATEPHPYPSYGSDDEGATSRLTVSAALRPMVISASGGSLSQDDGALVLTQDSMKRNDPHIYELDLGSNLLTPQDRADADWEWLTTTPVSVGYLWAAGVVAAASLLALAAVSLGRGWARGLGRVWATAAAFLIVVWMVVASTLGLSGRQEFFSTLGIGAWLCVAAIIIGITASVRGKSRATGKRPPSEITARTERQ